MLTRTVCVSSAYWLLCGVIGAALVVWAYPHGIRYIKLYCHFFLYPLFFGWLSVALVMAAFPFVSKRLKEWGRTSQFWIGIAVFSAAALAVELSSENIAPWEIAPAALADDPLLADYFLANEYPPDDRQAFQNRANQLVAEIRHWSLFRWYYPVSFYLQAYALFTVLFVAGVLARYRLSGRQSDDQGFRRALTLLTGAMAVAFFYSLMRIAFSHQKERFYPGESNPAADWVILGLFVVAILLAAACFWAWLGEHFAGVLTFVFGGSGLVAGWRYRDELEVIFGVNASFSGYLTILFGVVVVGYLWHFVRPPPDDAGT